MDPDAADMVLHMYLILIICIVPFKPMGSLRCLITVIIRHMAAELTEIAEIHHHKI